MDLVVLAAGKGKRMKSEIPKVLHRPGGRKPIIKLILDELSPLNFEDIVIVTGYKGKKVRENLKNYPVDFVTQKDQLGTAHAVKTAKSKLSSCFLVINGDLPLIKKETISKFMNEFKENSPHIAVLTTEIDDPEGYGRVIRGNSGRMRKIVEEKDLTGAQKDIKEINTGIYAFSNRPPLWKEMSEIDSDNRQNEFYLTDIVDKYQSNNKRVIGIKTGNPRQFRGVNTRSDLARAGCILNRRKINQLLEKGISMIDPHNTYIDGRARIGKDTSIWPSTYIYGETTIGRNCKIGPNTTIVDSEINAESEIKNSVLKNTEIRENSSIGPFSTIGNGKGNEKEKI